MNIETYGWTQQQHIVIAVSTGIDSMCLLHQLLHDYASTYQQLTCLHVNHGLRTASSQEEAFLTQYCNAHHINLYTTHLDLSSIVDKGNSIQNEARQQRYQWFDEMMTTLNADVLLTAHHLDDQIETIMYHLFTGKSTRHKLGIAELSTRQHYQIFRPLIHTSKADIKKYQQQFEVPYFEDDSNKDNKYVRNDIRNRIIPIINQNIQLDTAHLLKLKRWHDQAVDDLKDQALNYLNQHTEHHFNKQYCVLSRSHFNNLNYNLKVMVFDQLLSKLQSSIRINEKTYYEWFSQFLSSKTQFIINITDKWIIQIVYDKLVIMAKNDNSAFQDTFIIDSPGSYSFNHYLISIHKDIPQQCLPMVVRTRQTGDKFKLNGRVGHKKVNRLLIDHKVAMMERQQLPIITDSTNEIVAIGQLFTQDKLKQWLTIKKDGDE